MKKHTILMKLSTVALALLTSVSLTACGGGTQQTANHSTQTTSNSSHTVASAGVNVLARLNYHPNKSAIVTVNHNRASLKPNWSSDHVYYSKLDALQRTSYHNEGWLDKRNLAHDKLRVKQTFRPTGYHQKFVGKNKPIVNRGHEIAYSLSKGINQQGKYNPKDESGDQNNPRNLFTQTTFSNQELQAIYESKTRQALRNGDKVVYQVQPIFQNKDEMAKGVHMQAISTNRKLNYNVYIFNVQPGFKFNYATGKAKPDSKMKVPTPKNAPHYNDDNDNNQQSNYHQYRYHNFNQHHYPRYYHHHYIRDYMMYRAIRRGIYHVGRYRRYRRYPNYTFRNRKIYHYHRF